MMESLGYILGIVCKNTTENIVYKIGAKFSIKSKSHFLPAFLADGRQVCNGARFFISLTGNKNVQINQLFRYSCLASIHIFSVSNNEQIIEENERSN